MQAVGGYSKGMKRKLTIAAGIIHSPRILFLDEPTTGIDVASARQIRGMIAGLNESGTTVFLTTHYIEEAERLCSRIAFIVDGRLVRVDTPENLIGDMQERRVVQLALSRGIPGLEPRLHEAFPGVELEIAAGSSLRAHTDHPLMLAKTSGAVNRTAQMPATMNLGILTGSCVVLFFISLRNIRKRWIH